MHRDTINRVDETPTPLPTQSAQRPRPVRRRAIGVVALVLLALVGSTVEVFAGASTGGLVNPETTQATTTVTAYQEGSARITYNGRWANASYSGYSGGRARGSIQRNAGATFAFTGKSVSWVGPVGPTRGAAKVYVDGTYVKTVSTYASRFVASKTLFSKAFTTSGAHTLRIVIVATTGHPLVAIDKFTVSATSTSTAPVAPAHDRNDGHRGVDPGSAVGPRQQQRRVDHRQERDLPSQPVRSDGLQLALDRRRVSPTGLARSPFAPRRAAGVTFDGGGGSGFGGLSFEDGAHDQTWDGFTFANMAATESGHHRGRRRTPRRAPHHITCGTSRSRLAAPGARPPRVGGPGTTVIYIAHALSDAAHTTSSFENLTVDGRGGLASAVHFDHGDAAQPDRHERARSADCT